MIAPERFVPLRVGELTDDLAAVAWNDGDAADCPRRFRSLARLVSALYHMDFHQHEQAIVDAWDRIDETPDAASAIIAELTALLEAANYTEVTPQELEEAFQRESLVPLRLEVDLDDYEDLLIYRRGTQVETVEVKRWKGLRTKERTITVQDRVVVFTRVRSADWFAARDLDPAKRNLVPGAVSLKQFRAVPRADIKTLLPSTKVRFRPIDSVVVGVPAVVSGIVVLATKLLPTLGLIFVLAGVWLGFRDDEPNLDQAALVALLGGIITLGGFLVRQWTKLKNRRVEYLKTLSETLFFRMLGDGLSVVHMLLSTAEQQEVVEVLVSYRFLLEAGEPITAAELDERAEQWLRKTCHMDIDFDVDDALVKLCSLHLVEGDERLQVVPLEAASAMLNERWDALFADEPTGELMPKTKTKAVASR